MAVPSRMRLSKGRLCGLITREHHAGGDSAWVMVPATVTRVQGILPRSEQKQKLFDKDVLFVSKAQVCSPVPTWGVLKPEHMREHFAILCNLWMAILISGRRLFVIVFKMTLKPPHCYLANFKYTQSRAGSTMSASKSLASCRFTHEHFSMEKWVWVFGHNQCNFQIHHY